ncbi:hypothetical protein [Holzapfeliella floricola]|nr:hypothetical protein [Holzapfeliella floricola]
MSYIMVNHVSYDYQTYQKRSGIKAAIYDFYLSIFIYCRTRKLS